MILNQSNENSLLYKKYFKRNSLSDYSYGNFSNDYFAEKNSNEILLKKSSISKKKFLAKKSRMSHANIISTTFELELLNFKQINFVSIKSFKNFYPRNNIENILETKKSKVNKIKIRNKKRNQYIISFIVRMKIKKLIRQMNFAKNLRSNVKKFNFRSPLTSKNKRPTNIDEKKSTFLVHQKTNKF